jgi:GT2 family glycosyltransferase
LVEEKWVGGLLFQNWRKRTKHLNEKLEVISRVDSPVGASWLQANAEHLLSRNGVFTGAYRFFEVGGDISLTPLFNPHWYRKSYAIASDVPALEHYLKVGFRIGNDPSAVFDTNWYRKHAEEIDKDLSPMEHYIKIGWRSGVDPHPLFSTAWYLDRLGTDDLDGLTPLEHYLVRGWKSGLSPCSLFNVGDYCARYPDIAAAAVEPLGHFLDFGLSESRQGSGFFDDAWYRSTHRDDPSVLKLGELAHYLHVNSTIGLPWSDDSMANRLGKALVHAQRRAENSLLVDIDSQVPLRIDWDGRAARLEIPRSGTPRVSVVIPTFNHSQDVIRCLESIASSGDVTPYEVILVDDGSDEVDADRFRLINDIRLVVQTENSGFAAACEAGVAASTSEFIHLLNNDTEVVSGWLDGLVEEFDRDPATGVAGSMIINLGHRLQEAGVIIFSDGSGMQYGSGDSPLDWQYRSRREVDYCSGCSLLIRRALWDELDGFDDRFSPAYFEDVDLCFSARSLGHRVVYSPRSILFHNEGSSAGDDGTGTKRFQFRNKERFVEKWRSILNSQPAQHHEGYGQRSAELFRDRERRGSNHVLIIDHRVPTSDRDSGSLRMARIMEELVAQGRTLHFLPKDGRRLHPYTDGFEAIGIEVIGGMLGDSHVGALIEGLSGRLEMVIVARPDIAAIAMTTLLTLTRGVPLVYDMVDAHGARVRMAAEIQGRPQLVAQALQLEHLEAAVARIADVVVTVSEGDEAYIERVARIPLRTVKIPNVHLAADTAGGFDSRRDLLFVGGYEHQPNVDAVVFLVHEVLPLVLLELPEVRVVLVGSHPPLEVSALRGANVICPGWVEDLDPVYAEARVVVAPLRYGAGVKGKVGEALSHGVPVVTTAVGAEGLSMTDGKDVLLAETPESLAAAIISAYQNPELWESLRENGLALVDDLFGEGASKARVNDLLATVADLSVV